MNPEIRMDAHIRRRAAASESRPWLVRGIMIATPALMVTLWNNSPAERPTSAADDPPPAASHFHRGLR
jgi:hypothetical protein